MIVAYPFALHLKNHKSATSIEKALTH